MVRGLEKFKSHFEGFEGKYTLIGGVACGLLFEDAGLDFRGTQESLNFTDLKIQKIFPSRKKSNFFREKAMF